MRKNKFRIFAVTLFVISSCGSAAASMTSPAIQARAIEIQKQDEELGSRIEQEQKLFIEKVAVNGISFLPKNELEKVIAPFVGQWLSQEDIESVVEAIKQLYKKYRKDIPEMSVRIKHNILDITASIKS